MVRSSTVWEKKRLKLAYLFNSLILGVVVLDKKGTIAAVNETAGQLLAEKERAIKGMDFRSFIASKMDTTFFNEFLHFKKNESNTLIAADSLELSVLGKNHNIHSVNLELIEEPGSDRFYLGIIKDGATKGELKKEIAQQKEQKEFIQEQLERERELGELKTRFVSMASHEFRTPLAGVLSSMQLVRRYLKAEDDKWQDLEHFQKVEAHFHKIEESVNNLNLILNDFLSLDKLQNDNIPYKKQHFNVKDFLQDIIQEMKLLKRKDQTIDFIWKATKKEAYLDEHLLRHIMENLISNSIKYSDERAKILVNVINSDEYLQISVQDNGIGIPLQEQKYIFKRFFRAENAFNYSGTGLGLHIVKKYIELMGGTINFESEVNKGTTFTITFPYQVQ